MGALAVVTEPLTVVYAAGILTVILMAFLEVFRT